MATRSNTYYDVTISALNLFQSFCGDDVFPFKGGRIYITWTSIKVLAQHVVQPPPSPISAASIAGIICYLAAPLKIPAPGK